MRLSLSHLVQGPLQGQGSGQAPAKAHGLQLQRDTDLVHVDPELAPEGHKALLRQGGGRTSVNRLGLWLSSFAL